MTAKGDDDRWLAGWLMKEMMANEGDKWSRYEDNDWWGRQMK